MLAALISHSLSSSFARGTHKHIWLVFRALWPQLIRLAWARPRDATLLPSYVYIDSACCSVVEWTCRDFRVIKLPEWKLQARTRGPLRPTRLVCLCLAVCCALDEMDFKKLMAAAKMNTQISQKQVRLVIQSECVLLNDSVATQP